MQWPCHLQYNFANVVIVDLETKKIILSKSEDREEFTPYGGEQTFGEQIIETGCREVIEETGGNVQPTPDELISMGTVSVFPEEEVGGIWLDIETFVYFMKDSDKIPNVDNQEHEEGCRIVGVLLISLEELFQQIEMREIKLFPNFIAILPKIEKCIDEHFEKGH